MLLISTSLNISDIEDFFMYLLEIFIGKNVYSVPEPMFKSDCFLPLELYDLLM